VRRQQFDPITSNPMVFINLSLVMKMLKCFGRDPTNLQKLFPSTIEGAEVKNTATAPY